MRLGAAALLFAITTACSGGFFKQFEYEEDVYLALDGSATVYVNGSLAALNALRGASFDLSPSARFNTSAVRAFFSSPVTRNINVENSRRLNRRFAHVRLEVSDVRHLADAAPFAWSSYAFALENGRWEYRQVVGEPAGHTSKAPSDSGWTGDELVAFRLHLPSTILDSNAGEANHKRGNILVWEQKLADRLRGQPITMTAQIETETILSHTLWLFGGTAAAVVATFIAVVWWVRSRPVSTIHAGIDR
jgi:hypothetical protein